MGSSISSDLKCGDHCYVARGCRIGPGVELGDYVMVAPGCAVVGSDHNTSQAGTPMIFSGRPPRPPTLIESDVWIGFRAIIIAGVRIGRGAVIGAGAVVTRDVEAYSVVAGVPARKVSMRFNNTGQITHHNDMLAGAPISGPFAGRLRSDA
jgi:acetyltransferase-like isoleucine patch superfamily enzyme